MVPKQTDSDYGIEIVIDESTGEPFEQLTIRWDEDVCQDPQSKSEESF